MALTVRLPAVRTDFHLQEFLSNSKRTSSSIYHCSSNIFSRLFFCFATLYELLNPKAAGSIPDGVTGIVHWHNPSGRIMVLGSTQSLTEMSTRNISWG